MSAAVGYITEGTFYGFLVNSPNITEQQEDGELIEQLQDVADGDYMHFVESNQRYIYDTIDEVITGSTLGSGFGVTIRDFAEEFVTRPGDIQQFFILTDEEPDRSPGVGGLSPFQRGDDFNLMMVHSDNDPARLSADRILEGSR